MQQAFENGLTGSVALLIFFLSSVRLFSVEVFINTVNNSRLDSLGFRPFGIVPTASLAVVDALYVADARSLK